MRGLPSPSLSLRAASRWMRHAGRLRKAVVINVAGRWRGATGQETDTTILMRNLFLAGHRIPCCRFLGCQLGTTTTLSNSKRMAEIRPLVSVRHEQSGPQSAGSDRWPQFVWPRRRYKFGVVCTPTTSLDHRLSMHLTGPVWLSPGRDTASPMQVAQNRHFHISYRPPARSGTLAAFLSSPFLVRHEIPPR
jgi:hypothetical protein